LTIKWLHNNDISTPHILKRVRINGGGAGAGQADDVVWERRGVVLGSRHVA
jgi:hypothetical protein